MRQASTNFEHTGQTVVHKMADAGGVIESLDQLEQISGYGKPLLSYHVQGAKDSKGLADLGLLEVEKGDRGKISARLTTLGKLLVSSKSLTRTS